MEPTVALLLCKAPAAMLLLIYKYNNSDYSHRDGTFGIPSSLLELSSWDEGRCKLLPHPLKKRLLVIVGCYFVSIITPLVVA